MPLSPCGGALRGYGAAAGRGAAFRGVARRGAPGRVARGPHHRLLAGSFAVPGRTLRHGAPRTRHPNRARQGQHQPASAVSRGLVCNHEGALPHETLGYRRAECERRGARFVCRTPLPAFQRQPLSKPPYDPPSRSYITLPPTIVYSTSAVGISSSGIVMMSFERMTTSASLPGVSEPLRASSKAA